MPEPVTIYGALGNGGVSESQIIIDVTDTEAFLVRKEDDGGDIFAVDTINGVVSIGGVTPVTGCRLILPQEDDPVTPTLAFGDGDTGFYERIDDEISIAIGGSRLWRIGSTVMGGIADTQPALLFESSTGTNPNIVPDVVDVNTGIGRNAADQLSLITGGVGSHYINAAGSTNRWCTQESVADSGKVTTMPTTSNGGIGFAQLGDGEEYALFTFTSAGVVTLIANSANVGTTEDNDTTFNIYDAGTNIGFNNELGSTKNLFVMLWYN